MNYISDLSSKIVKSFKINDSSFKRAIKKVKQEDYYVKFYRNTLLIIDTNLSHKDIRLLNFAITSRFDSLNIPQNKLKKYKELKILYNYCLNENHLHVKYKIFERPDFILKGSAIEITEAITPNQAIIRDILTKNVDSGKTKADLLDYFDDIVKVNHVLAAPTLTKAKHNKLDLRFITNVIIDKINKFNTIYKVMNKNIILVDVYDTLSFTNSEDLKIICDSIFTQCPNTGIVDEVHLYNDVFNIVGKIYLHTKTITVEPIKR